MLVVILVLLLGIVIAFFASQNNNPVDIHIAEYTLQQIPLSLVMLTTLLTGIIFTWIVNLINAIPDAVTSRDRNKQLKKNQEQMTELTKQIHQLELQNEKLKAKKDKDVDEKYL